MTRIMEERNIGIGPKNQRSKLRAKYKALSPSDQNSPPLIMAISAYLTGMLSSGMLMR